ncbi:MAG: hypothetical protein HYX63_00555 [Gammaproteobacteria bacterium]|nr:hypothetical protein [Gammaproteobacteria bacterium]
MAATRDEIKIVADQTRCPDVESGDCGGDYISARWLKLRAG